MDWTESKKVTAINMQCVRRAVGKVLNVFVFAQGSAVILPVSFFGPSQDHQIELCTMTTNDHIRTIEKRQ
jgi:hypothetical protein